MLEQNLFILSGLSDFVSCRTSVYIPNSWMFISGLELMRS